MKIIGSHSDIYSKEVNVLDISGTVYCIDMYNEYFSDNESEILEKINKFEANKTIKKLKGNITVIREKYERLPFGNFFGYGVKFIDTYCSPNVESINRLFNTINQYLGRQSIYDTETNKTSYFREDLNNGTAN